jgi:hypothetical protein
MAKPTLPKGCGMAQAECRPEISRRLGNNMSQGRLADHTRPRLARVMLVAAITRSGF